MASPAPNDQVRFAADEYRSYRPVWPAEVFRRVLARVGEPRARAVDLGAGTGLVALRLLEHFQRVTAVEPDAAMLARLVCDDARLARVSAAAEAASFPEGSVDLVTAGNAFHWMDGAAVLERAWRWLRPGGALALFRYDPPHRAEGPLGAVLAHEYGVLWDAHVHPRLRDPDYARRTLAASRFGPTLERVELANPLTLTVDDLIGFSRSTSYGGGYARAQPDPEAYWRAFRARIAAAAGAGPFRLDFRVELLLGSRA